MDFRFPSRASHRSRKWNRRKNSCLSAEGWFRIGLARERGGRKEAFSNDIKRRWRGTRAAPKWRRVFYRVPTNRCVNLMAFYPSHTPSIPRCDPSDRVAALFRSGARMEKNFPLVEERRPDISPEFLVDTFCPLSISVMSPDNRRVFLSKKRISAGGRGGDGIGWKVSNFVLRVRIGSFRGIFGEKKWRKGNIEKGLNIIRNGSVRLSEVKEFLLFFLNKFLLETIHVTFLLLVNI